MVSVKKCCQCFFKNALSFCSGTIVIIQQQHNCIEQNDQVFALKPGTDRLIIKPVEPDVFMSILIATEREFEAGKILNAKPQIEAV